MQDRQQMQYTLRELVDGIDASIQGNPDCLIDGVCTIQEGVPGRIAFLMNPLYKKHLQTTRASAVIVLASDAVDCPVNAVISHDPYYTYTLIARRFDDRPHQAMGIHPTAVIGKNTVIDPTASVGPHTTIGSDVVIGPHVMIGPGCCVGDRSIIQENTRIDANVVIYHHVKLGKRVLIASGTVVGSDGFGIAKHKGVWHKVPQLGSVIIEDDVEIGAGCTIDRGAIGDTVIEQGVKLDNLIQIGHNVRIGKHTAMAAYVGVSGSTTIGSNCMIGGKAGFAGHLTVADNVIITGGTVVSKSIRKPGVYSSGVGGVVTNLEWRKNSARLLRLNQLTERVKALESALEGLTERNVT